MNADHQPMAANEPSQAAKEKIASFLKLPSLGIKIILVNVNCFKLQ